MIFMSALAFGQQVLHAFLGTPVPQSHKFYSWKSQGFFLKARAKFFLNIKNPHKQTPSVNPTGSVL